MCDDSHVDNTIYAFDGGFIVELIKRQLQPVAAVFLGVADASCSILNSHWCSHPPSDSHRIVRIGPFPLMNKCNTLLLDKSIVFVLRILPLPSAITWTHQVSQHL